MPSFPPDCVSASPGLRLRPVPELGACLAYDPVRARLHTLNPVSWLILTLCDGRPRQAIAEEFARSLRGLPGTQPEPGAFSRGLAQLEALGLVATHPSGATPKETPR